jgi:hypothetical protein
MRIAIIILVCLLFSGAGVPLASDGDDRAEGSKPGQR